MKQHSLFSSGLKMARNGGRIPVGLLVASALALTATARGIAPPALETLQTAAGVFVENHGQWADADARLVLSGRGVNVALTDAGARFQLLGARASSSGGAFKEFAVRFPGARTVTPTGETLAVAAGGAALGRDAPAQGQHGVSAGVRAANGGTATEGG